MVFGLHSEAAESVVDADTNTKSDTKTKQSAGADTTPSDNNRKTNDLRIESEITAAQRVVLDLEQCFRHLHRTAGDLINECTQQEIQVVATADDVGPILLAPPLTGVMPAGGFLPCRKKFIDLYMNQLHDIVPMAAKEAEGIELDDEARTATASDALQLLTSNTDKLMERVKCLDKLTKGPDYDNEPIYKESKALQEQATSLRTACKTLFKELKREDKSITKELHLLEKQGSDGKQDDSDGPSD